MLARIMVRRCSGSKSVVGVATQRSEGVSTPNLPTSTLRSFPLLPLMDCHPPPPPVTQIPTHYLYILSHMRLHRLLSHEDEDITKHFKHQHHTTHNITSQKTSTAIFTSFAVHLPLIHCCIVDIWALLIFVFSHCSKLLKELTVAHTSMLNHILNDLVCVQLTHTVSSVWQMQQVFSWHILSVQHDTGSMCSADILYNRCSMFSATTLSDPVYQTQ